MSPATDPRILPIPKPGDTITFRGCMWNAGWEFDAPCVLYSPVCRYGYGGNSGHLRDMVDSVCVNLICGWGVRVGFDSSDAKEFKWRGWSPRNFAKRKLAWHREMTVRFFLDDKEPGLLTFEYVSDIEWWGKDGRETAESNER